MAKAKKVQITVDSDAILASLVDEYIKFRQESSLLEDKLSRLREALLEFVPPGESVLTLNGNKVTHSVSSQSRLDQKTLCLDHPNIAKMYTTKVECKKLNVSHAKK
jgi:hypothetical protein